MNKTFKIIIFGFLMWVAPFLVSVLIYPLKTSANPPFFESIMPVVIAVIVVLLSIKYFTNITANFLKEGILIGYNMVLNQYTT